MTKRKIQHKKRGGALNKMAAGGYTDPDDTQYDSPDLSNYDGELPDYGSEYTNPGGDYGASDGEPADENMGPDAGDGGAYSTDPAYVDASNAASMAPFSALQAKQKDALTILREAQKRAADSLNPTNDKSAMWLSIASGLLSPTRTGGLAESVGNAAGNAAPYEQKYADADQAYKSQVAGMDYDVAQALYKDANKTPQIIDWYARNPDGSVGKQKAMVIDGQPIPFGEIFTPGGKAGANGFQAKLDWYQHATPQERGMYDKLFAPKANQSIVNVQSSVPFETESQKKAADRLDDLFKAADTSRNLSSQLNAVAPYIDKTPDAYFGPGGKGLVTIGKALKQSGLYDAGEGLDNAGFVDSIMSHLGPAQRIVGSGSSSDRDVALFMNSLPGLSQTKDGNKMLIKYYNKLNDYNQKLVRIIRSYAKTHQDFYGVEDLPTEEINKAGRVFSDADLTEMQGAAGGKKTKGVIPKGGLPHAKIQEDEDGVTIELGTGN